MTATIERNLLIVSVTLLALAATIAILGRVRGKRELFAVYLPPLALAALALSGVVAGRWMREGQGPFLTLYDVLVSNLLTLTVIYLVAAIVAPLLRATAVAILPFLAALGVWLLNVSAAAEPLPPTFDNPWLWAHVLAGKFFLGLALLASGCAALTIAQRSALPGHKAALWQLLSLAFVCHSFMLIAGAVWAHSAWGRYWAWDPLETWAFVTWLAMALLLHARVTFRQMPDPLASASVIGIFVLAFLTFFGVPFLSVAPHKGVM